MRLPVPASARTALLLALLLGAWGLLAVTSVRAAGSISFAPPVSYAFSDGTFNVAAADLDNDGHQDIAVGLKSAVSVIYGYGNGTFDPPVYHSVSDGRGQITPADVDADGALDLVVAATEAHEVVVLRNIGGRQFAAPARYPVGSRPFGVEAGHFNGDGRLDLATSNDSSHDMSVLLNNGNGTFAPAVFYPGGRYPARIAVGDYNRDNRTDLAMSNFESSDVILYFGNGAGSFTVGGKYQVRLYPGQVVTDDFNLDGRPDLATANTFDHTMSVLIGNGDGTFQPQVIYPGNTYPHIMQSADFDGDGDPDLAAPNNGTNYFSLFENRGNGTFENPVRFTSGGNNTRTLTVGDFNEDGRPDVAVGNEFSLNVSVFLNTTAVSIPAAPTGLQAIAVSATEIALTWTDNAGNETGFQIERKTGSGSFGKIADLPENTRNFEDGGLLPATSYSYRVRAVSPDGASAYSNTANATTPLSAPAAPNSLTADACIDHIRLSWIDRSDDETGFEIERKAGDGTFSMLVRLGENLQDYTDTTVGPGSVYTYRVRAVTSDVFSGWSNTVSATMAATAPLAKLRITPKRLNFGKIPVGGTRTKSLRLRNSGREPLQVCVQAPLAPFALAAGPKSFTLAPGEKRIVSVHCTPPASGRVNQSLLLSTNAPQAARVSVWMKGTAR